MSNLFPLLAADEAPEKSRPALRHALQKFGFVPTPLAAMSASPTATLGFGKMVAMFDASSLGMLEREVVVLTVARAHHCHYCVAMHSSILSRSGGDASLVHALRAGEPLGDARLEALRTFTLAAIEHRGEVPESTLERFVAAGFSAEQALDVLVGIAAYTLSTFANRLTRAPLDDAFAAFAWSEP
ncbi:MAG: hypothetical protein JWM74_1295 [Myxococcaceae bacterium]|nr:hypothetical protein [Myxococcaceae bacterium]